MLNETLSTVESKAMPIRVGGLILFTVEELAELLGVRERTIREYLRDGRLKGRKIARRWYVPEESLRKYFGLDEEPEP